MGVEVKDMGRSVGKRDYVLSSDPQKTAFTCLNSSAYIAKHICKIKKCRFFAFYVFVIKGKKVIPSFWY